LRPWVDPDRSCWVKQPRGDSDWDDLALEYAPGLNGAPFRRVLEVAREGGCRTVVIENRYVDVDYRSEYTAFWSLKFDNQSPFARRFHFFAADLAEERLHRLTERQQRSYLGYSVIRPVPYGRVGRTVLAPPRELGATLTTITDRVSFFGHALEVEGVPFCQQDSEYLRCAHAAAWICHYVAARRGEVGRRSTAEIVELSPAALSPERALPSNGLNYNQLQVVFAELEQPAILYGVSLLPQVVGVENPVSPDLPCEGEEEREPWLPPTPHGLWDTRMISIICRYLNSGFPVLIGTEGHAFVLVGWRRDDEGVVQFIACDDAVGPYEVISSPFEHYKTPWDAIMIPLPPRVFMSGESAENRAHKSFASLFAGAPKQLGDFEEELEDGRIELRTALRTGASFKEKIERVTSSDEILSLVRNARLPHWVWVVEAHRRSLCDEHGSNCVVAAAVFDSTAYDIDPPIDLLTMPGFVVVFPPDDAETVIGDGSARPWGSLLEVH
jgi:hypothetical protein